MDPIKNLEAEQAVIGAALYRNSIIEALSDIIPEHFAEPTHAAIWKAMQGLYRDGKGADPLTVNEALQGHEGLKALGGGGYLADLYSRGFPSSAKGHADLILNNAQLRQVRDAASEIGGMVEPGADAFSVIAHAERTFGKMVQDAAPASENLIDGQASVAETLDQLEHEIADGREKGYMTGLRCIDYRLRGLRPGWLVVIAARPSMGKEQPIDTPVLTPWGWSVMGAIKPGDYVIGGNGLAVKVLGVYPQGIKPAYRVGFRDMTSVECGLDHLWTVYPSAGRSRDVPVTMKLSEMMKKGVTKPRNGRKGAVWRTPELPPVYYAPNPPLPVHPYFLGVLLGDGCIVKGNLRFSASDRDRDIMERVREVMPGNLYLHENRSGACPYFDIRGDGKAELAQTLDRLGVRVKSAGKVIPAQYFSASVDERMELLRGLMDTDGSCVRNSSVFHTIAPGLAYGVAELARSLGALVMVRSYDRSHHGKPTEYQVRIRSRLCLFHTAHKASKWRPSVPSRYITSVEYVRDVEQVCIQVDAEDGLYVTKDFIVTHNTALARVMALNAARRTKDQIVFFALEMSRRELDERTLSQLSYEAYGDLDAIEYRRMGAEMTRADLSRLRTVGAGVPSNFIIDDSPILSVDYVRRRVLALKRKGPVGAVFIDYLQIMERPDMKGRNEASVIGEMTKGLKQLAREAETCVVLLSQINRGVEQRDDKRPQLSDLRESGAIEQDANAVLFPYREVYYIQRAEPDRTKSEGKWQDWQMAVMDNQHKMQVIAAKVRQGSIGTDNQVYIPGFDFIEDVKDAQ